MAWLWGWLLFVIILFFVPLGFGWGYRRWRPPYRGRRPGYAASERGWGWVGTYLWIVFFVAFVWLIAALIWGTLG